MRNSTRRSIFSGGRSVRTARMIARVVAGLEQAGELHHLEHQDGRRLRLVGGETLVDVAVLTPPRLLARLTGQLHQVVQALALHTVERRHVAHVPRGRAHLAGLDARDLRDGHLQAGCQLLDGQTGLVPELAQLDAKPSAPNLRAVAVAMILGLVILVLLEARWILGLWIALHRRWRATLWWLRDEAVHDEPERNGASTSIPGPRGG
jgi:hypothetical protein